MTCHLQGQKVNPREWLNDVIARLPYYQEKDSGKDIRELLPDVWKLKKSNENPIEV
jgi:transposase